MSFVLDASVLVKLFRREEDSAIARSGIVLCAERGWPLLAPHLVVYEVLSVSLHYEVAFDIPLALIADMRSAGFRLLQPSPDEFRQAEEIATSRPGAADRPPQLQDSIYHAMAIQRGGTFVTADRRHIKKTGKVGHVVALSDWRPG